MARRKTINSKRNGRAQHTRIARDTRPSNGDGAVETPAPEQQRLPVLKTYKIFINGQFPRTESGRYYVAKSAGGASGWRPGSRRSRRPDGHGLPKSS